MNMTFFIWPAVGGGLGWLLSGDWELGVKLFAALAVGQWLGRRMMSGRQNAAHEAVVKRMAADKAKIIALADTEVSITNDQVQKLLGVSDATATNYLSALESEGGLVQVGDTGSGVHYRRNG